MKAKTPIVLVSAVALALTAVACGSGGSSYDGPKVVVLGIDGMDYGLSRRLIDEGRLPNLAKLEQRGGFQPLGTSVPPLSPIAWSNFITGLDSGGHGIFDFVHREPDTMLPYLSTSRAETAEPLLTMGQWQIPGSGDLVLLRQGKAYWEVLEERGIETAVLRMPANFPPSGTASYELSGMGTTDIIGSYGTFSFYTSELFFEKRDLSGGEMYELDYWDGIARGKLHGPENPFLVEGGEVETDFRLYVDNEAAAAKLVVGDEERILQVGEWSDWVTVNFDFLPDWGPVNVSSALGAGLTGIGRFYLRQIEPEVELYVSPLNFDPMAPAAPISTPDSYAAQLAEATGRFYTQGMPEDTHAMKGKILTTAEFMQQAQITAEEIEVQYEHVLETFDGGMLFYYFGNLDLVSHMMWHTYDPEHPAYTEEDAAQFGGTIESLYEAADAVVGHTLENVDDSTLVIVMSDHGFSSWRRTFNLNNWLLENGYLALKDPDRPDPGLLLNVDWSRTRAYALGLNGLYLNVRGRERNGIVGEGESEALLAEIGEKLLAEVDPATGGPAITKVYPSTQFFKDRGHIEVGPDMIVGYAKGTRGASDSALGEFSETVYRDNIDDWSGDHGMDHESVPGVLFTSRELKKPVTSLSDLAAAVVAEFGVEEFPGQ